MTGRLLTVSSTFCVTGWESNSPQPYRGGWANPLILPLGVPLKLAFSLKLSVSLSDTNLVSLMRDRCEMDTPTLGWNTHWLYDPERDETVFVGGQADCERVQRHNRHLVIYPNT
jgi:hypothetical protein